MAVQQDYAKLATFMDGNYLEQLTSASVEWDASQQRVDLLNEGLGGFTPGSGSCKIELGFAVPIGGPEAEYIENLVDGAYVTMQMGLGKKSYVGKGKIMTCRISQSTGAAVEGTLTWEGEFKKPQ